LADKEQRYFDEWVRFKV